MHPTYHTFAEMLSDQNNRNPDKVAIITAEYEEKISLTYHELYLKVMELADRYRRENCSCVGLYANGSVDWIITMFASVIAGKRTVLFDVLFQPEQMMELVKFCGVDSLYAIDHEGRQVFGDYMNEIRAARMKEAGENAASFVQTPDEIEESGKLLFSPPARPPATRRSSSHRKHFCIVPGAGSRRHRGRARIWCCPCCRCGMSSVL